MSASHNARFRFSAFERWIPLPILLCFLFVGWNLNGNMPIFFAISLFISLYWIYRLIYVWLFHYIIFIDSGIIVRKGFLFIPCHFKFNQITNIHTIKPDKHINFQIDEHHIIQLPLSRMNKQDRIRFIFLIESDVNRLSINTLS